jgi:hypothetical protein
MWGHQCCISVAMKFHLCVCCVCVCIYICIIHVWRANAYEHLHTHTCLGVMQPQIMPMPRIIPTPQVMAILHSVLVRCMGEVTLSSRCNISGSAEPGCRRARKCAGIGAGYGQHATRCCESPVFPFVPSVLSPALLRGLVCVHMALGAPIQVYMLNVFACLCYGHSFTFEASKNACISVGAIF